MLKIIIVGYNEELNLTSCVKSILDWDIEKQIIYIDQSSTDNSVEIVKSFCWVKIFVHPNKWYADPDKKWAYDTHVNDWERCLILDADETLSNDFKTEVRNFMNSDNDIWDILIDTHFLNILCWEVYQMRLFKKWTMHLNCDIHNYFQPISNKISRLKNSIQNLDRKTLGIEVSTLIRKIDKYTNVELKRHQNLNKINIIFRMIFMPILRFFWFWIRRKLFFRWIAWWMYAFSMGFYQFSIYAKLYENLLTKTSIK